MYPAAIGVVIGATIGNFIGQAVTNREWNKAAERSFFQAVAIGAFLIVMAIVH